MIPRYRRYGNVAAAVFLSGIASTLAIPSFHEMPRLLIALMSVVLPASFLLAFWFYLKAKARSGWWMLLVALNLFGLAGLLLLKDHAKDAPDRPPPTEISDPGSPLTPMQRFLAIVAWGLVGPLIGATAAFVVFYSPVLFFGQPSESMVGWGWFTMLPAFVMAPFAAGAACKLLLKKFELPGADLHMLKIGGIQLGVAYALLTVLSVF